VLQRRKPADIPSNGNAVVAVASGPNSWLQGVLRMREAPTAIPATPSTIRRIRAIGDSAALPDLAEAPPGSVAIAPKAAAPQGRAKNQHVLLVTFMGPDKAIIAAAIATNENIGHQAKWKRRRQDDHIRGDAFDKPLQKPPAASNTKRASAAPSFNDEPTSAISL